MNKTLLVRGLPPPFSALMTPLDRSSGLLLPSPEVILPLWPLLFPWSPIGPMLCPVLSEVNPLGRGASVGAGV